MRKGPYDELKDMGLILSIVFLLIFGCFFVYFSFDFLDDFLKGINVNQTTVENIKDIYGAKFTQKENYRIYFGETWMDWLLPTAPRKNHNFLEFSYKIDDSNCPSQNYEMKVIRQSKIWDRYWYGEKSWDCDRDVDMDKENCGDASKTNTSMDELTTKKAN